jgi:hypothetical protein
VRKRKLSVVGPPLLTNATYNNSLPGDVASREIRERDMFARMFTTSKRHPLSLPVTVIMDGFVAGGVGEECAKSLHGIEIVRASRWLPVKGKHRKWYKRCHLEWSARASGAILLKMTLEYRHASGNTRPGWVKVADIKEEHLGRCLALIGVAWNELGYMVQLKNGKQVEVELACIGLRGFAE